MESDGSRKCTSSQSAWPLRDFSGWPQNPDQCRSAGFFSSDYVTLAAMAGLIIIRAWGFFVTYWLIRQLAVKTLRWLFPFGYFSVGDSTGWGLGLWWATPIVLEFSGRYLL